MGHQRIPGHLFRLGEVLNFRVFLNMLVGRVKSSNMVLHAHAESRTTRVGSKIDERTAGSSASIWSSSMRAISWAICSTG